MKKLAILILITSMALSFTGASCLNQAQDMACNPPANVIALANAAAPVIAMILNLAVPGSAAWINAANAAAYMTTLRRGACISMTQLNELINFLSSPQVKSAQVAMRAKVITGKAQVVPSLDVQALVDWRKSLEK